MTESFYDVLGVDRDADEEAIREAYRERLKETHPDVSDDPDADQRTAELVEAKETLLDPSERERYDRIGHEAYVSGGPSSDATAATASSGPDERSAASAAADRVAGDAAGTSGPTNARASAAERRARERAARERVEDAKERVRTGQRSAGDGGKTKSGHVGAPSWSDASFGTTMEPDDVLREESWLTIGESPATVFAAFTLYPILVAGAVFPPFPLWVNVVVGVCTVAVIAAMQSMPGVGVIVFASWGVLGTLGLLIAAVHPLSFLALLVFGTTWFPFGLTLLTYWVLHT